MKRIYITLSVCAAVCALSCTREMHISDQTESQAHQEGGDRVSLTFFADNTTKTTLNDDFSVSWNEGDQVKIIWNGGSAVAGATFDGDRVKFTAAVDETGPYYAVYPADTECEYVKGTSGEDSLRISIPSVQKGSFESCAVIVGHTTRSAMDFGTFKSAVSLVSFKIDNPAVRRVEFDAADECGIIGKVNIPGAVKSFEPKKENGAVSLSVNGAGTYYLAINPGTTLGGLAFHVGTEESWLGTAVSTTPATVERGRILIPKSSIDSHLSATAGSDVFICPAARGDGDGTSWDNAGDVNLLKKILGSSTGVSVWKADGSVLRVAQGSYDLSTDGAKLAISYNSSVSISIVGGYSASSSGKDLSLQDPTANETIFTTSATEAEGRVLYGNNSKGTLNFEGITISGVNSTTRGAAAYFNAATTGPINFKNCTFKDNTSTSYGIVCAESAGTITFDGCSFCGNSVSQGTLCNEKNGTFVVKNCSFEGNTATSTSASTGGAAIFAKQVAVSGVSGSTIVENSTFKGNTASSGGAVMVAAGNLSFDGCTFEENEARNSFGGAATALGNSSLDFSGCTINDNIARATGGGAIACSDNSTVRLNLCRLSGNRVLDASDALNGNGGALLQVSGKKSTLFLCNCTFDGNAAKTNGPDLFSSAGTAACIYNCTSATPVNNSATNLGCVRCNCPMLIANSTMVVYGAAGTTSGVVTFGSSGEKSNVMINNLMLSNSGSGIATGGASTKREVASWGHNVFSAAPNINFKDYGGSSDLTGKLASDIWDTSPSYNAAGVVEWNGPAALDGFTPATASEVEAVIKAYNPSSADDVSQGIGTEFYNWLTSIEAFGKDAAGNSRGTGAWWPGSYQKAN